MVASQLLDPKHPLYSQLRKQCERAGVRVTKRQARKYLRRLRKYPQFR